MKKHFSALLCIFALVLSHAFSENYEDLAKNGSITEILQNFRADESLPFKVFGHDRENFLMLALRNDREIEIIDLCVRNGTKLKLKSKTGKTALMYACQYSTSPDVVLYLVDNATTPKNLAKTLLAKSQEGKNCFDYAWENPENSIYAELSKLAEDPKQRAEDSVSRPLEEPAEEAEEIVTDFVPEVNAEPVQETVQEEPAADQEETEETVAATVTEETAVPEIIEEEVIPEAVAAAPVEEKTEIPEKKAVSPQKDSGGEVKTAEKAFLYDYMVETIQKTESPKPRKQISERMNPDTADKNGLTPLMVAAKTGNDWELARLLEAGANTNLADKDGWTALMYAARYQNNAEIIKKLIDSGARTQIKDRFNTTPLLIAADYSQNPQIIEILLKNRSNTEEEVFKAFIFAITGTSQNDSIRNAKIDIFLKAGVPLNRLWKDQTPLMYAAQFCSSTQILKILLDAGAKTEIMNSDGKKAFDYAKENKRLYHDDIYWQLNSEK